MRNAPDGYEIAEIAASALAAYASVSIAFDVTHRLARDPRTSALVERPVAAPYRKDYDALPDASPTMWSQRFDLSRWALLAASRDDAIVGGAAVAPAADVMPGEITRGEGAAVLWDLRVDPAHRGRGLGAALFRAAMRWSAARGCDRLVVETQDINVVACRLYARAGCTLLSYEPGAYTSLPDETRLVWQRTLGDASVG